MELSYSRCSCGAITIYLNNGQSYSCLPRNKRKYMPGIDLRKATRLPDTYCCNHCTNHYGLDVCACGCGNQIGHCPNNFDISNQPMQILYGRTSVRADDALSCR